MADPTNKPSATPPALLRPHPDWDSDDAHALKDFLASETGLRALAWLKYWAPELLDGSHMNKTLVASGQVKGYTAAVENLHSLCRENPIPEDSSLQSPEYPSLDDDTKWSDEQNKRE